jgi:hypothetical protein
MFDRLARTPRGWEKNQTQNEPIYNNCDLLGCYKRYKLIINLKGGEIVEFIYT